MVMNIKGTGGAFNIKNNGGGGSFKAKVQTGPAPIIYDVDFTTLTPQDFVAGGDGNYTIDGKTWMLWHTSGFPAFDLNNTYGLTGQLSGGGYYGGYMGMSIAWNDIMPGVDLTTKEVTIQAQVALRGPRSAGTPAYTGFRLGFYYDVLHSTSTEKDYMDGAPALFVQQGYVIDNPVYYAGELNISGGSTVGPTAAPALEENAWAIKMKHTGGTTLAADFYKLPWPGSMPAVSSMNNVLSTPSFSYSLPTDKKLVFMWYANNSTLYVDVKKLKITCV